MKGYENRGDQAPDSAIGIRYVKPGGDAIGFLGLDTAYWRNPLGLRFGVTTDGDELGLSPSSTQDPDGWGHS